MKNNNNMDIDEQRAGVEFLMESESIPQAHPVTIKTAQILKASTDEIKERKEKPVAMTIPKFEAEVKPDYSSQSEIWTDQYRLHLSAIEVQHTLERLDFMRKVKAMIMKDIGLDPEAPAPSLEDLTLRDSISDFVDACAKAQLESETRRHQKELAHQQREAGAIAAAQDYLLTVKHGNQKVKEAMEAANRMRLELIERLKQQAIDELVSEDGQHIHPASGVHPAVND